MSFHSLTCNTFDQLQCHRISTSLDKAHLMIMFDEMKPKFIGGIHSLDYLQNIDGDQPDYISKN